MAQFDRTMAQLKNGDKFPPLQARTVNHGEVSLPDSIADENYAIVLGYRAHW